jgi:acyl-CoA reductase-like NAD-dependent aldehyde dehydrogenase
MSTQRILVQASIFEQFKPKLQAAFTAFLGSETKHAVLVSRDSATKFKELISDAVSKGAQIVAAPVHGDPETQLPATHVGPSILQGVTKNMKLYYTESFGPSVTLSTFADSEEAISIANDTEYGLTAAIFGKDLSKVLRIAGRIESGAVHINGMTVHDEPGLPHGGVKDSGFGRFGANAGLQEFQRSKTITFR